MTALPFPGAKLCIWYTAEGCHDGTSFNMGIEDPLTTIDDLIRDWNARCSGLVMEPVRGAPGTVRITSCAAYTIHAWNAQMARSDESIWMLAPFVYLGSWAPMECRAIGIEEILGLTGIPPSGPIVVASEHPLVQITAFLYRKKGAGYYTRQQLVVIPPGFYSNTASLAAFLNLTAVSIRGERNGFIYNFSVYRGQLCIAATHRQPIPSQLMITPVSPMIGLDVGVEIAMPLRTNRYVAFPARLAGPIL